MIVWDRVSDPVGRPEWAEAECSRNMITAVVFHISKKTITPCSLRSPRTIVGSFRLRPETSF